MKEHVVGSAKDLPPGTSKIIKFEGREIGIFNVNGQFFALHNRCPHQGAPLCLGPVDGTNVDSPPKEYQWGKVGQVLRCPWHGWEFDLKTGKALFNPEIKVKTYTIKVENEQLILITG